MGTINFILLCIFALLQFGDYFTTTIGLGLGYVEKNPIANWIMKHGGVEGLFIYKLLITVGVALMT